MPKIRALKPETWTDEKIVSVSPLARLLFLGSWNFCCDNGHLDDSPLQLKMRVLPADSVDVSGLLDELISVGLMTRKDGYLKIPGIAEHQKPNTYWLSLCDHCGTDVESVWTEADKKVPKGRAPAATPKSKEGATGVQQLHHRDAITDVDVDVDVDGDKNPSSTTAPPRPDVEALCNLLADLIEANGSKRPTIGKGWHDAARLLLDRDGKDHTEAANLIRWSQADEFWKANILSMPTFRAKYDRLRLKAGITATPTDDFWSNVK